MIRGEILNAKTSQASAQHQREVSSLGRIQERESQARSDVKRREQKFWREVSHAAATKAEARGGQDKGPRGASLARALEAHRLFTEAKAQHCDVSKELRAQLSKVMRTKFAVDTFSKLRKKALSKCEHRRAERSGEQMEEALSARRLGRSFERTRPAAPCPGDAPDVSGAGERENGVAPPSSLKRVEAPPRLDTPESLPLSSVDNAVRVAESLSLQSMRFDAHPSSPTLTVKLEHSGAPLVCRLAAAPSGEMGVVVGAVHGKISETLERHRPGIVSKLSELGFKVSSLEVRREVEMSNSERGSFKRGRRSQEERDENTIA